ncbi:undecaprenyl pyrophosphate phosphatase [Rubripirellula lacrimiformis]|uniref:Undecaprenyl pyrophosphate phosphatase n=1 Tax=Rubripirellula lacrimiformis TaxID=1930273 RepID=A0A517NC39_9BACT|nr:phosphatase PAP2 family protein [Rubripirellula lacrimiformis]QDT04697.1 undecaprenyl pyrophosphate phosphatase [Rubripirellula lacrimiformis]
MKTTQRYAFHHRLIQLVRFFRGREPIVLLGLLMLTLAVWGFIELTDEVLEGSTDAFDRWAVQSFRHPNELDRPIGPSWMAEVGRDITALGGIAVLLIAICTSAGFLAINRAYRAMIVLIISTLGGMGTSLLLKSWFDRPRPDFVPHLSQVYTSSFPSGHSMMSAVVYLTLAAIVAPVLRTFWLRFYVIGVAVALTVLVGVSRVYMGVHYPTDVLAGWAAGLAWALMCWLMARTIVEKSKPPVS